MDRRARAAFVFPAPGADVTPPTASTESSEFNAPVKSTETFLRIEKGSPDECELAALTSVLLARAAALTDLTEDDTDRIARRTAGWRRLERRSGPSTPRSWRDDTPH
jgi:hypothetical protein